MAKKVLICMTDGTTVEGVLGWTWKDCLKVKQAIIHTRADETYKTEGVFEVYPYQILWVQQLGQDNGGA